VKIPRLIADGLLAVGLATGALAMASAPASAQTLVPLGRVVLWSEVSHALPPLEAPADGAINGYGFDAAVTGDECEDSIGVGTDELTAPGGARVCVFSLGYESTESTPATDTGQEIPQTQGTIRVGSQALPLSWDEIEEFGTVDYAVAVPDGEGATLSLSAADFAQSFSLTGARPVGVRPDVLYAPAREQVVKSLIGETYSFPERSATDGHRASMTAKVASAALDWFLPGNPLVRPTKPDEAFLAVNFGETGHRGPGGTEFTDLLPEPGSAVRLSVGGKTEEATAVSQSALGVLSSAYVFTVPADLQAGRILVDLAPTTGTEYERSGNPKYGVTVLFSSGSVRPGSSSPGVPTAVGAASAGRGSGTLVPVAAGTAGGVTVIVIPLVLFWRRRRRGERLVIVFPPPVPMETDKSERVGDPAEGREPDQATQPVPPEITPPPLAATVRAERPRLTVGVLGPILVDGLGAVARRHAVAELCCYLALNAGREVPSDELRTALGSGEATLAPAALYNLVAELRRALGEDVLVSDGHAGYRFTGEVICDWLSFQQLVKCDHYTDAERIANLQEAVLLVRGYPFQAAPKGRYEWASESNGISSRMAVAIENAVVELVSLLLAAGRDTEAYDAAQVGISAVPYSYGVNTCLLKSARKDQGRLERTWREVSERLGDVPELRELKDALVVDSR